MIKKIPGDWPNPTGIHERIKGTKSGPRVNHLIVRTYYGD